MRFMILSAITLILLGISIGILHEQVHVQIYRSYNISSSVDYFNYFPDFVTIAEKPCPTETCILAHNINESIGYHLLPFYISFSILLFNIVCLLELNLFFKLRNRTYNV